MEREILEALFGAPDRFQDHHQSTRPVRTHKQSSYGRIVAKPMEEKIVDDFTFITRQTINSRSKCFLISLYSFVLLCFLSNQQLFVFAHSIMLVMQIVSCISPNLLFRCPLYLCVNELASIKILSSQSVFDIISMSHIIL